MINKHREYLLDTHALIWWWIEPKSLSHKVLACIENPDNRIFVSAVSMWEIATKHRKGKLNDVKDILADFSHLTQADDFVTLSINWQHARLSGQITQAHADPFDRMLVAQAKLEQLILISCDNALKDFDVNLYW